MKVIVFSAVFGVVSLVMGSAAAQSRESRTDRKPASGSSSTTEQSPLVTATAPGDLPDAPQPSDPAPATQIASGGPWLPHGIGPGPLLPQTFHEKFMTYAVMTYGPRALLVPAIPAAIRMANPPAKYPTDWQDGGEAFGRNYGDHLATMASFETGRFAVGAALHEDIRYHPSASTNFFLRTGHALAFTFVDRSDDGHARLALANFAGLAAGSYVGMSYLPAGFNDVTHADQRLAIRFGALAGGNVGAEFAPDIFRFFTEHHVKVPRIPIPDWWTR